MDQSAPLLQLIFTPNRSLGSRGFFLLMSVTTLLGALIVLRVLLLSSKAWPIAVFIGLDVALLYWAFRANYRSATQREDVRLDSTTLDVRQRARNGDETCFQLNPYWVKVELQELNEYQNQLFLVSHGRKYRIAMCLAPHERTQIYDELQSALRKLTSMSRSAY